MKPLNCKHHTSRTIGTDGSQIRNLNQFCNQIRVSGRIRFLFVMFLKGSQCTKLPLCIGSAEGTDHEGFYCTKPYPTFIVSRVCFPQLEPMISQSYDNKPTTLPITPKFPFICHLPLLTKGTSRIFMMVQLTRRIAKPCSSVHVPRKNHRKLDFVFNFCSSASHTVACPQA